MPVRLDAINGLPATDARERLLACCGSTRWAEAMCARRPFASEEELFRAADEVWFGLRREDWLEAFGHHPRIGDVSKLREKFAAGPSGWAAGEQAGVRGAGDDVLERLARGNRDYEARFGHIFLVCATGKTAAEMLALLTERMANGPDDEMRVAAGEQAKITRLRLAKL